MQPTLSFKVDVDTHDGMKNGVPKLLDILAGCQIKATFFLAFGPDNSGKAIWQIFRQKGFLKKMVKTKAPKLYGWRTVFSGTLLPARPIATAFPDLVRCIRDSGHDVGVHAWDHRLWQDHLHHMSREAINTQFARACGAFHSILGDKPQAVASPSWQATPLSLAVEDTLGILYASDLRGGAPCFPQMENYTATTLQLPTTTRCLEELLTMGVHDEKGWEAALLEDCKLQTHTVFPLHAEVEGGPFAGFFAQLLPKMLAQGVKVITMQEYAQRVLAKREDICIRQVRMVEIPGRGGCVAAYL
jgi:hypothetical protein